MSLNQVMSSAMSALKASETGLKVASQNIANVNTPGYSRVEIQTAPRHLVGQIGAGVDVSSIRRATDRFLNAAALNAESRLGAAEGRFDLLDRAQAAFGDPASDTSTFSYLERAFSAFTVVAGDSSSTILRTRALSETQAMFDEFARVGDEVYGLRKEANERVADATALFNGLLQQISDLNGEIQTAKLSGGDASSAENLQDQIATELATLLDVRISPRRFGGVEVRTAQGDQLVGESVSEVRFTRAANGDPTGVIELIDPAGSVRPIPLTARSGLLGGLVEVRDVALSDIEQAVRGLAAQTAEGLNAAYNQNTVAPAPASLTGAAPATFVATDPLGFTGAITIGVVSNQAGAAGGALLRRIEVNFDAGSLSVNGGAPATFSTLADLNAALGAAGAGASIAIDAAGRVTLAAAGPNEGVVVQQGAGTVPASARDGRGFAHYFGLNDLVRLDPVTEDWKLVSADPQSLALARPTLSVTLGERALSTSDSRGASFLGDVRAEQRAMPALAGLPATTQNLVTFAATVGGIAGARASEAKQAFDAAIDFRAVARERRDDAQTVNLDEELVKLTKYQQSYAAAAKVMQAATEMLDMLMQIA